MMDTQIIIHFLTNEKAKEDINKVWENELERRLLLQNSLLLRYILNQQFFIDGQSIKETQEKSTNKQGLNKLQHEKKLLENKINLFTLEIENWKKKSLNQISLQKENIIYKNQITKLNSQLNDSKNEINKIKQQFITQKAVLESKLENTKKIIKNLKDSKDSKVDILTSPIKSFNPLLSPNKPINKDKLPIKKPLVSNFSVSPFLSKNTRLLSSPLKDSKIHPLSNVISSTPTKVTTSTATNNNNILAQSTPDKLISSLKIIKSSGLKNLLSPVKEIKNKSKLKSKSKKSLFDMDEDEDEDLFGNSIRKIKKEDKIEIEINNLKNNESINIKKKKRKIGAKTIIDEDENTDEGVKFSPLKKIKLMDKLGGISPLKQRNKERNLFKV